MIEPIKFAKGGKSEKTTDIDIIKGIQNLLGANDEEMEQLLQVGIKKYGSIGKIGEAIQESVSSLPQGYSYEDVANAVMTVFSPEESQMFKCGGKMQQLVAKHSKGKKIDCGCGGTKIALGREGFPHGTRVITQKDTLDTYGLPTGEVVERRSFTYKPDIDYVVSSYKPEFVQKVSTNPTLQNNIGIFAEPFIGLGLASRRISPERYKQLESARNNTDFEVEEKQSGGSITDENNVKDSFTRNDALSTYNSLNSGTTRRDARIAYRQAKKDLRSQGLRGSELRQAARTSIMTPKNLPDLSNVDFGNLDESIDLEEPEINFSEPKIELLKFEDNYDGMSFGNAFNKARKSGLGTFTWRGNSYNTNLRPSISEDERRKQELQRAQDFAKQLPVGFRGTGNTNTTTTIGSVGNNASRMTGTTGALRAGVSGQTQSNTAPVSQSNNWYNTAEDFYSKWNDAYMRRDESAMESLYNAMHEAVSEKSRNYSIPFYNFGKNRTRVVPEKYSDIGGLWKRSDANTNVSRMLDYLRAK